VLNDLTPGKPESGYRTNAGHMLVVFSGGA
jgi:hypothetical protein